MSPKVQIVLYICVAIVILGFVVGAVVSGERIDILEIVKLIGAFSAGGFLGKILKQPS